MGVGASRTGAMRNGMSMVVTERAREGGDSVEGRKEEQGLKNKK